MAHDHHFLSRLDRLTPAESERALGLYRDHELVRRLLGCSRFIRGSERVAISLDHPLEGPFVIVARNGHFVTCLGRGMRPQIPIISTAVVASIAARLEERRVEPAPKSQPRWIPGMAATRVDEGCVAAAG